MLRVIRTILEENSSPETAVNKRHSANRALLQTIPKSRWLLSDELQAADPAYRQKVMELSEALASEAARLLDGVTTLEEWESQWSRLSIRLIAAFARHERAHRPAFDAARKRQPHIKLPKHRPPKAPPTALTDRRRRAQGRPKTILPSIVEHLHRDVARIKDAYRREQLSVDRKQASRDPHYRETLTEKEALRRAFIEYRSGLLRAKGENAETADFLAAKKFTDKVYERLKKILYRSRR